MCWLIQSVRASLRGSAWFKTAAPSAVWKSNAQHKCGHGAGGMLCERSTIQSELDQDSGWNPPNPQYLQLQQTLLIPIFTIQIQTSELASPSPATPRGGLCVIRQFAIRYPRHSKPQPPRRSWSRSIFRPLRSWSPSTFPPRGCRRGSLLAKQ